MTKLHPSVTVDRLLEAMQRRNTTLDNPGICRACGADQEGCEPDARNYRCERCGEYEVFAPEELTQEVL